MADIKPKPRHPLAPAATALVLLALLLGRVYGGVPTMWLQNVTDVDPLAVRYGVVTLRLALSSSSRPCTGLQRRQPLRILLHAGQHTVRRVAGVPGGWNVRELLLLAVGKALLLTPFST